MSAFSFRLTQPLVYDHETSAEVIARALGGRRTGRGWSARCPAHDDRTPSLSLHDSPDGKVLVRCHAGCDQGRVIAALRGRGLWGEGRTRSLGWTYRRQPVVREQDTSEAKRIERALAIWESSMPAPETPVAAYLASRGLRLPPSDALRFHAAMKHPSGGIWPAMVALVTNGVDGMPVAVHRTFLARDGGGKAPVDPPKMMLGPCRGGAVRLAVPGELLMIAEGIETALSAMNDTGIPAWAALSTSGLRGLDLPSGVRDVIVLADGDDLGERAARDCAVRWKQEGRRVRIAHPPRGKDFNDLLMETRALNSGGAR
jgi:putative DNA primase/helicase